MFIILLLPTIVNATIYTPYWHDTTQTFRVPFNISGATTDLDNVTTTLNINAAFMGPNFDFNDVNDIDSIRIYYYNQSNNNYTLASHYATTWNAVASTGTLQIKAPFLNASINTPYMIYFGDSSKLNVEDYCKTYLYCDFFDDASMDARLNTVDTDSVAGTAFSESGGP